MYTGMLDANLEMKLIMTLSRLPKVPHFPFSPIVPLFLEPVDSELHAFLEEVHTLFHSAPSLVDAVEKDLDALGLHKKAAREADKEWLANQTPNLSGLPVPDQEPDNKPLLLGQGRPRTSGYVVLVALFLRGYWGAGFKSADVTSNMLESITLRVFFSNLGIKMPGRSTLTELVNAVSVKTRLLVLDAQVPRALSLNLDDFKTFLQDSTHVEGNTAWPTDSKLMVVLVARLIRIGEGLERFNLSPLECGAIRKYLQKMIKLNREIEFSYGKKDGKRARRRRYEKMLRMAKRIHALLTPMGVDLAQEAESLDVRPSEKAIAKRAVERLSADLDALQKVYTACEARVLQDKKVPMSEKVLSLSDPDAGFISKGQREPVIGYKPQVARSGAGFVTGLHLPQGNAPDSKNLLPMVDEVIARTKVTPTVVSVDDGYASAKNKNALEARNIEVISINGAKGRALTPPADWDSDVFGEARNKRSAVESLMYTLKHGFDFGEVARRGLLAVHAELLEKALAYNACVTVRRRREAAHAAANAPRQATA